MLLSKDCGLADAIVASEKIAGMSDRGLRRLFDRLVELGAVRVLAAPSSASTGCEDDGGECT